MTARARGSRHWVCNTNAEVNSVEIGRREYPLVINQPHNSPQSNAASYVQSARSAWLRYPYQQAADQLSYPAKALLIPVLKLLACPLSTLLSTSRLEHAVCLANHLISTNLYDDGCATDWQLITENLSTIYPQKPLLISNICPSVNPQLYQALLDSGWQMIPARRVYLCDPQQDAVWRHNHVKRDQRLLEDRQLEIVWHHQLNGADLPVLRDLFRQLFIHKHSGLNPDFSPDFFSFCLETGFLELLALRYQGRLVGVLGLYQQAGSDWITTPLIGYDTTLPKELGIYRRLMALLLQQARQRQLKLHYSSGAGQFKQARGGMPAIEYSAVYGRHLQNKTRFALSLLQQLLSHTVPPLLKKFA